MNVLNCEAIVDDDTYMWAKHFNWTINSAGYACIRQSKQTVFLHKIIMDAGVEQIVDHKDRNKLNCLRLNLRPATHSENTINSDYGLRGKSRFRGVDQDKRSGKWRAYIQKNKVRKYLGMHETEIEAAQAYNDAAKDLHGEFARLNLITG
jgi:hypothetical protein